MKIATHLMYLSTTLLQAIVFLAILGVRYSQ